MSAERRDLLRGLALAALTLALYLPVTDYGFIWDDEHYVEYNTTLRSVEGLGQIWTDSSATPQYYPLVHSSFWLEYQLWGLDPRGYHNTNILLHALAAVLLWRVFRRLEIPGAWVAAAVFAVHPVNVESVAWITERKNVLALCFYLASALAYLRFALEDDERTAPGPYLLSLALFTGALLSKTVACSLPAALLLVLWWKRGHVPRRRILELAPFFVLGVALGLLTVALEKQQVGASGADWDLSFVDRCLIAGRALWFYAGKLLWPTQLAFFYERWEIDARQAWQYLYPAAALGVLAAAWTQRHRFGTGPLVALLVFGGTLLPALGFFDVYPMRFSFVADHFQYLATPAFIALVVGSGASLAAQAGTSGLWLGRGAAVVVILVLALLNRGQQPQFRDLETLWRTTLEKNPTSWAAAHNLGMDLAEAGQTEEAISLFRRSLELRTGNVQASNALALALSSQGRTGEAIAQYRATLAMDPDDAAALNNLARILAGDRDPTLRDLDEAERLAERARELAGEESAKIHTVLADIYHAQGRLDDAIASARQALELARRNGDEAVAREAENRIGFYELLKREE